MPPASPSGFDARFTNGRILATVDEGKNASYPIIISTTQYPVKLSWNLKSQTVTPTLKIGTKEIVLSKNGSTIIDRQAVELNLKGDALASQVPKEYALDQNFPNPFNPSTAINYQLAADSKVSLKIYNMLGDEVKTVLDETQEAGYKAAEWNSTNNFGNVVASGVYFYRLTAVNLSEPGKSFNEVKKMVLLK